MTVDWPEFFSIAMIHLLAVASPGPDFAVVVRHSIHYGKRVAIITSLGVGTGILVHVGYSIFGLGFVLTTTPWLFNMIKYVAAAYLLYLAYGAIRSSKGVELNQGHKENGSQTRLSVKKAFTLGFVTNGINPKATLFFISLFGLVVQQSTPLSVKIAYGIYLALATAVWFCGLSLLINTGPIQDYLQRYSYWIDRAMGVLLVIVAVNILFFS
jgi:RhtB (resistance to homoserine/threonine) family protein